MAVHTNTGIESQNRLLVQLSVSELRALIAEAVEIAVGGATPKQTALKQHTVDEVAEILLCSSRHVRKLIAMGRIKSTRLTTGRSARVRIPHSEVERILRESTG